MSYIKITNYNTKYKITNLKIVITQKVIFKDYGIKMPKILKF